MKKTEKMKKIFILAVCVLLCVSLLAACGGRDPNNPLVGKWAMEDYEEWYYEFKKDGTGKGNSILEFDFKWAADDTTLTFTYDFWGEETTSVYDYVIEGDKLVMTDEFDFTSTYIYK